MSDTTNGTGGGNGELRVRTGAEAAAGSEIVKSGFAETALQRQTETSSDALAAQATASVQARYVMALKKPRDWEVVRVSLLKACKRPLFAQDAIYAKPMGGETIQGPSIRFAEEAARAMTNVLSEVAAIYDDSRKRIVRVTVTDLESNLTFYKDVNVEKVVERKHPKKGTTILGQRLNSYGDPVYLVPATEDETATKEAALCSKQMRELLLRLLPSDIKEDAFEQIRTTRKAEDAANPDAAKRKVIDGFFDLGVDPKQLAEFIGHDLGALNPAELQRLRLIFAGLKDGETTWADVMAQKRETTPPEGSNGAGTPPATTPPEGKRISLKKPGEGGAPPSATATPALGGAARPAADLPLGRSDVPNSTTVVKDGKQAAAVATKLASVPAGTKDAPKADPASVISSPPARTPPEEEDKGDAPTEAELAAAADDDVPPWGGGKGKSK